MQMYMELETIKHQLSQLSAVRAELSVEEEPPADDVQNGNADGPATHGTMSHWWQQLHAHTTFSGSAIPCCVRSCNCACMMAT